MAKQLVILLVVVLCASCGGDEDSGSANGGTSTTGTSTTSGDETSGDADGDGWPDDGELPDEPVVDHRSGALEQLTVSGPDTPWASMSRGDREMYMVGKVMPIMNELFVRQFGERAAHFGCETCHGDDMREVAFAMPSQRAMPVPREGSAAYARMERQFPDSVRFMREVVTPTMGTLLGIEGYTCHHCHPGGR